MSTPHAVSLRRVLWVDAPAPHDWSAEQIDTLASYAAKASAALESR